MSDFAIKVENLSKVYKLYDTPLDRLKESLHPFRGKYHKDFYALRDVNFEVKKGETVGIIGRNGSGKSTLLKLITGVLTPSNGKITVNGKVSALLELGGGFNPEFTGIENIYFNATLMGYTREEIDSKLDEILSFADIGDFVHQPVKIYSSGMFVRLAFACAVNVDPDILIVDEALAVGDELFQRKCFSCIEAIRTNGTTILFVSHSGGTIVELCNSALLMDEGEKLAVGAPKQIVGHYQKLLYAPANKREAIREKIRQGDEGFIMHAKTIGNTSHEHHIPVEHMHVPKESFDPNLKPSSTIKYESRGAFIESLKILTLTGEQVNGLVRGRKYRYCYKVFFDRTAEKVRFGMLIKTTSGLAIGGAISASLPCEAIPIVESGKCVSVEFSFNCYLNPGIYFLNAGVLGFCDQEETFLHRQIDAIAFRVLPLNSNTSTEIIDFGCEPLVSIDE